jgi:hypothetical protein
MRLMLGALSKLLSGECLINKNPIALIQELDLTGQRIEEDFWQLLKMHFCGQIPNTEYIERVDEQAFNQPYIIKGTDMYGFFLKAKCYKLQEVCDKYLNIGSSKFYCPAAPWVVLTINKMKSLQSIYPPDYQKGYLTEQEAIFWFPVFMGTKIGSIFKPEKLVWFLPYVFVNNSPILISGREVLGYTKQLATFKFSSQDNLNSLSVNTLVFEKFSPDTEATENAPIIEATIHESVNAQSNNYQDFSEFFADTVENLKTQQITIPNLEIGLNLISTIVNPAINTISLKEFRDIENSSIACYKAIAYTPLILTNFHGGRIIQNSSVKVYNYPSHQICQELGLSDSQASVAELTPFFSYYINFDFRVDNGTVLWDAWWPKRCREQGINVE